MKVVYLKTTIKQKFPRFQSKMTRLGAGIEAVVYSDGEFAYKSCRYNTNYVKWLLDLRKNKLLDNPHVPEVYTIYVDKHKKECLIKMELLKEGNYNKMCKESRIFEITVWKFLDKKIKRTRLTRLETVAKHLADFIHTTRMKSRRISLDMHSGNVMMRHKQLVLTDPVV